MVLIPVIATALVGLACAAAIWHSLSLGRGFDDSADLREATLAATALADRALAATGSERAGRLDDLDRFLDKAGLALDVTDARTGEVPHSHGAHVPADDALLQTLGALGGDATVEQGGRTLTVASLDAGGRSYELHFFGDIRESAKYPQLKASVIAAAILVLAVVLASSALASRVVARLLVRRFEEELDRSNHELAATNERLVRSQERLERANDELTRSGQRLERANEQLRHRDAARRQLLADISHDLRSPLTSIRGYAEGLLDGVAASPERQRHYLKVIRDKTEQVSGLVESLLAFSKLELDDYPVRLEPLDLTAFATECAQGFEALHEGALTVSAGSGGDSGTTDNGGDSGTGRVADCRGGGSGHAADATVRADRELLGRAISNVLDNSVKYREGDRARVHLTVRVEGAFAVLVLADEGRGVGPGDTAHLFDPFFRTDAARERPEDGSGMGLAFVRRAVELMGGSAVAQPLEPHGLAIELRIPLAIQEQSAHQGSKPHPATAAPTPSVAPSGSDQATKPDASAPEGPEPSTPASSNASAHPTQETGATHGEDPAR